jgi:hypothetical protein
VESTRHVVAVYERRPGEPIEFGALAAPSFVALALQAVLLLQLFPRRAGWRRPCASRRPRSRRTVETHQR